MKTTSIFCILTAAFMGTAFAAEEDAPANVQPEYRLDAGSFCLFSGTPPAEFTFTVIKDVRVGKQSYGGVKDVLPGLVQEAKEAGADAIINYAGSQRFGFFPWRMIRPVVRGTAIKWVNASPIDCEKMGGTTLNAVLSSNQAPPK